LSFNFGLDEQIVLRNDKTQKTYALTINQYGRQFDVTREWSIPGQSDLVSKTDRFFLLPQAAKHLQVLYDERLKNGYKEVMRRPNIKKSASKVEVHKMELETPTTQTNQKVGDMLISRQRTGLTDRIKY
jgi:hypothetical protein